MLTLKAVATVHSVSSVESALCRSRGMIRGAMIWSLLHAGTALVLLMRACVALLLFTTLNFAQGALDVGRTGALMFALVGDQIYMQNICSGTATASEMRCAVSFPCFMCKHASSECNAPLQSRVSVLPNYCSMSAIAGAHAP